MLPQLNERITKCECAISEIDEAVKQLNRNLSELRQQLQVDREQPSMCTPGPVLNGGSGSPRY